MTECEVLNRNGIDKEFEVDPASAGAVLCVHQPTQATTITAEKPAYLFDQNYGFV